MRTRRTEWKAAGYNWYEIMVVIRIEQTLTYGADRLTKNGAQTLSIARMQIPSIARFGKEKKKAYQTLPSRILS